jgi:hypothetical protein
MRIPILLALALSAVLSGIRADDQVQLLAPGQPATGWTSDNGREFPGAVVTLAADPATQHDGQPSLRLAGDFTAGGNYVQMGRDLAALKLDLSVLSFWLRAPGVGGLTMRLIDASGQCHQIGLKLEPPSPDWRQVSFPVERFFAAQGTSEMVTGIGKYEHWGGAKDGKWHGPLKAMYLLLGRSETLKTPVVWVAELTASVRSAAWSCGFDQATALPAGWTVQGAVAVDAKAAADGGNALLLQRAATALEEPCSATGPSFAISPGLWEADCAVRSELESQDSSYNGQVALELLDAGGQPLERLVVAEAFGARAWTPAKKRFEPPARAAAARFAVRLNKCGGRFWVDTLAAACVSSDHRPSAVERIVVAAAPLGHLFKPDEARTLTIAVETRRPLADAERVLSWGLRDYWGAEQGPVATVTAAAKGKANGRLRYEAQVDLAGQPLEAGRYYEVHVAVPLADGEPARNYSALAILPEAAAKAFKPEQVPFTARDWDNRIPEYLRLSDRLGIRTGGIWGEAAVEPPYKPSAPSIEICAELGMGVLTCCPGGLKAIEDHHPGYQKWTEEATRGAIRSWLAAFGTHRPLMIDLGNEPHNTGARVVESVHAYKIAYDEIKKLDPAITVIATSIPPTEEYFQAGYQDACDVFDFHIYEDAKDVRAAIAGYQALMAKYRCVKPIWSTEIGLNSQGQTRQHIAGDMVRKVCAFFAAGGASISWFDLLYPDPDAKDFGSSGDAMNVFDSRYRQYCPRLDAVMLYNLVNGICVKRFAAERDYPDGVHACLFRDADGHALAALWKDHGRQDAFLPLAGVHQVQAIRIDGRRSALDADGKGLGLTIGEDPLLLAFDGAASLPPSLAGSPLTLTGIPATLARGAQAAIEVAGAVDPKLVTLVAPSGWQVERQAGAPLRFLVTVPAASAAREADLLVRQATPAGAIGTELSCRPAVAAR